MPWFSNSGRLPQTHVLPLSASGKKWWSGAVVRHSRHRRLDECSVVDFQLREGLVCARLSLVGSYVWPCFDLLRRCLGSCIQESPLVLSPMAVSMTNWRRRTAEPKSSFYRAPPSERGLHRAILCVVKESCWRNQCNNSVAASSSNGPRAEGKRGPLHVARRNTTKTNRKPKSTCKSWGKGRDMGSP